MEEDEYYDMERENCRPRQWRWQRTEESYVTAAQNIRPTTTMGTMLKVEELMTIERNQCAAQHYVLSQCGQTQWKVCEDERCYGCDFKLHAIVDLRTTEEKGETIITIGQWART
eukprot:2797902-Heterocapsa_arctica.AAC.2